ncbi:hypothetical protein HJC23_005126 [Cyclotella cryptica]|uniref:Indole-3-glycerol-phosphate synthase n=1 Tax=Cyclotella cryptica TaxID=29204 RepID=A0ABD3QF64_9STRA
MSRHLFFLLAGILLAHSSVGFGPSRNWRNPMHPAPSHQQLHRFHIRHSTLSLSSTPPLETIDAGPSSPYTSLPHKQDPSFRPSASSFAKLATLIESIQRPRGLSIGVEYAPTTTTTATTRQNEQDIAILSMQLRKFHARAIYTSNVLAAAQFVREQQVARGNFPEAVGVGVDAVVLEYDSLRGEDYPLLEQVGVIWKVSTIDQLQHIMEQDLGNVFLLSDELLSVGAGDTYNIDVEQLREQLSSVPKSAILIAPLPSMLPQNLEVTLGKSLASSGSISSLLLSNCCVNDDEDLKYAQFAIEGITKKSSSSFSMTGLTGSTNGHFGVSSHVGEVKWRRKG